MGTLEKSFPTEISEEVEYQWEPPGAQSLYWPIINIKNNCSLVT